MPKVKRRISSRPWPEMPNNVIQLKLEVAKLRARVRTLEARTPSGPPPTYGPGTRLLICGSRDWANGNSVLHRMKQFMAKHALKPSDLVVIEGGANGADLWGRTAAESLGIAVMEFPANWDKFRKAAGPIRNAWMLRWGRPDVVMAFHKYLPNSRGTKDMVERAEKEAQHRPLTVVVYDR